MTHYQKPATNYFPVAAGVTTAPITSPRGYLESLTIVPTSTGGATVVVLDGTVAILSIPAAAHSIDPHPYRVELGINSKSTSAEGFKITTGASVACIAVARFQ
jgi:hypothetical protein